MYKIMRQKRKSVSISITDTLEVIVKAPYYVSEQEIEHMVAKHENWIKETQRQKKVHQTAKDWLTKGELTFLGQPKRIQLIESKKNQSCIKCIDDTFMITVPYSTDRIAIEALMYAYWKKEAYSLLTDLTEDYCKTLGLTYGRITIRNQKTRWGSCSSKGNLSYNIRLLGAPIEVIKYVVLHEVMHLKYFNHSQVFWRAIEEQMPNYKKHQDYLKTQGIFLGMS